MITELRLIITNWLVTLALWVVPIKHPSGRRFVGTIGRHYTVENQHRLDGTFGNDRPSVHSGPGP